ncbi:lysozyme inhibitor LprI family protein [Acinetobacter lwoffii]|uniref:lysozyme inhibitor LprI family protein n=1 Tax=Acinetobacter lwoffii TaxID=28090 RepID=UPI00209B3097|nr:lysozyme inhibitor LprI family protein [Acinetobacter lwoffii]MCO8073576.1 lysozyme inhibitor LprI family protein [Acinetobacter lwoffii]MCO8076598.1 lysozyme inhibitor LprI family protein [Acinetobacter lwoffii]
MKLKVLALTFSMFALAACDKVSTITGSGTKCDSDITKQIVVETFSKNVSDIASTRVKELIETENVTIDMGKLRSTLQQITFNVTNVRTNNSDPNSKKNYCATDFIVNIPTQMIKDADTARAVYEENNIAQAAVLSDLSFENNQLKKEIEYFVQPTDDGKKVFVTLENPDALAFFVRDIAIDSLLKAARQNAAEVAKQEEIKRVAQESAAAEEYQSVLLSEAQSNLDNANENLNLVWNSTTKEIRDQLLSEQRIWLKKRNLECKLESSNTENPEIFRLNCETNMTNERTNELRQKIYYLEP